ncbi:MAG TPA: response regulator [Ktedonobacterales bacterium]|nr:response regulator [Ktedonobacterales bacterium]
MTTAATTRATWRVLVVDDEQNLNWSLVNSLRKEGYVADGALTGAEAQRLLQEGRYDCVISDVKMPGMDGFELLQWLRQHQPAARVIMMTAFGSPTAREEALRGGVVAYLEKPFDLRALKEELQRLAVAERPAANGSESYDLLEVVRVINLSRRDIAMMVRSNGQSGMLRFVHGELHWAETDALRGNEAFLALCAPRSAQMQPLTWDGRTERNVTLPVSRLLYLALAERAGRSAPITRLLPPLPTGVPATTPATVSTESATPITTPPLAPAGTPSPTSGPTPGVSPAPSQQPSQAPQPAGSDPPPVTGPLMPPPAGDTALVGALAALGRDLPAPNVAALLKTDGGVLAHAARATADLPPGAYTHLSTAALATARTLLVADLGTLDEIRITTSDHLLLVRRVARAERTALLALMLPRDADLQAAVAAVQAHTQALLDATAR